MPGLVEAHFHPTYFNVAELADLDIKYPVEYVTLLAACNARLALECGYTAARSGGSLHNIDVWLKKAIEEDLIPGPRLAASGREICGAGGLMDWNPDHLKLGMEGLILLINGPDEARAAVRKLVKDGVEWIKTYPTGDAAAPDTRRPPHAVHDLRGDGGRRRRGAQLPPQGHRPLPRDPGNQERPSGRLRYAGARHLHGRGSPRHAAGAQHARRARAAVRAGEHRARARVRHAATVIDGHKETLEGGAESARMILKAGGRLGMGGDYGFAWNPHGDYAKELTFFVNYVGFTPLETITCATKTGAEIMGASRRIRHGRAGQAGRRPGRGRRRAGRYRDPRGPLAVHRRDAGRRDQGGVPGPCLTRRGGR